MITKSSSSVLQPRTVRGVLAGAILLFVGGLQQAFADDDPPGRVARLSYVDGDVSFAPGGEEQWSPGSLNRPMVAGDRLATSRDARAELELGDAELQVDSGSALNVANLDDRNAQFELSSGTVALHVRTIANGENVEVDTPTIAFVATAPGDYRIDVGAQGDGTTVKVLDGAGTVYGQDNASYQVGGTQSYQFPNSQLTGVIGRPLFSPDDFDNFAAARNDRYRQVAVEGNVSPDVIGAEDLDDNGEWSDEPEYGRVWYPAAVDADWAPYRYGHWAWIDPWGWTWVDDAPWGFAPFHYGRWVYVQDRWGWVPGPRRVRPVYSPALVGFVGGGVNVSAGFGGGGPVGWFPLGPRDVYCPPYRVSNQYFFNVNVSNVNDRYVNRENINNYYVNVQGNSGRYDPSFHPQFAYRNSPQAMTVVSHDTFTGARPVSGSRLRLNDHDFANTPVNFRSPALPNPQSLVRHDAGGFLRPPTNAFSRPIVTHAFAPPPPPSFSARQPVIARNLGQPLAPNQLQQVQGPTRFSGSLNGAMRQDETLAGPSQNDAYYHRSVPAPGTPSSYGSGASRAEPSPFDSSTSRQITIQGEPDHSVQSRQSLPSTGFSPRGNPSFQQRAPVQQPEQAPRSFDATGGFDRQQVQEPVPAQDERPRYQERPQYQEQPQYQGRPQSQAPPVRMQQAPPPTQREQPRQVAPQPQPQPQPHLEAPRPQPLQQVPPPRQQPPAPSREPARPVKER